MAKTGLFSDHLPLRLETKLSLSRTPSAELAACIDISAHFIDHIIKESSVK